MILDKLSDNAKTMGDQMMKFCSTMNSLSGNFPAKEKLVDEYLHKAGEVLLPKTVDKTIELIEYMKDSLKEIESKL